MSEKKKKQEKKKEGRQEEKKNFWGKFGDFVREAVDCCAE